ncbi:hypothetical protein V6N12_041963 [Hibiscus sabdariffa]|uniref:Uncharacterized protein n=1 Tax=Hibiscus sabdariffa TaxID=183260 RepID=A0ABR2EDE3_9ROSI
MEFDVKEWVRENLRNGAHFGKEGCMWDVFFGGICWFLLLYRNGCIFENPNTEHWSVLMKAKEWYGLMMAAIGPDSTVRLQLLVVLIV